MDTLIERKKRFTPKQIYGGTGVLFILVLILYFIFRDIGVAKRNARDLI